LLSIACTAGYAWIGVQLYKDRFTDTPIETCLVKHVMGIPCPSCGSTRSVLSILQGDFWNAIWWNPFGFLIAIILIVVPVWLIIDYRSNGSSLFAFYLQAEAFLQRKYVAAFAILVVIVNWIWNINKGL
jgi:Protein of unknown function (DUF2752)